MAQVDIKTQDKVLEQDANLYNLMAMHKSVYSIDDRLKACYLYVVEGNLKEVSRKTGVKYETLKTWKESNWWPAAVLECKKRKEQELDGMFTKVIDASLDQLTDRIKNGDFYIKKMEPKEESQ